MMKEQSCHGRETDNDQLMTGDRTPYEPPVVTTYSSEEIAEQAGPARACSPSPCGIF